MGLFPFNWWLIIFIFNFSTEPFLLLFRKKRYEEFWNPNFKGGFFFVNTFPWF